MKGVYLKRLVAVSVGVVCVFTVLPMIQSFMASKTNGDAGAIALTRPTFLRAAHAEGDAPAAFIDEAGMSAYLNLGQSLNLNSVDDVCRTVEASTSTYFQCSVGLTGYDESQDVKVYVEQNGWVLAYYPRGEATGRIFDWKNYDGGTAIPTKLEKAIERVVQKAGLAGGTPTYYHFAYPNANRMLLVADKAISNTTDTFQVNTPSTFSYFERSWSLRQTTNCDSDYFLNGQSIYKGDARDGYPAGLLTNSQLPVDTLHAISITGNCGDAFAGLALIYRVP
jgi:hypothetical protein